MIRLVLHALFPWVFILAVVMILPSLGRGSKSDPPQTLRLASTAFQPNGAIPRKHTCDGTDVSPQLSWESPAGAVQSFALIMDDPDAPAGTWVHWVLFDLPATARDLPEGVPRDDQLASGARQGRNDFRRVGYYGPCPPPGPVHRYFFKLYALDARLNLKPGSTKAEVERAVQGHILAQGELIGRYSR